MSREKTKGLSIYTHILGMGRNERKILDGKVLEDTEKQRTNISIRLHKINPLTEDSASVIGIVLQCC